MKLKSKWINTKHWVLLKVCWNEQFYRSL
jgi:hypothetical protein